MKMESAPRVIGNFALRIYTPRCTLSQTGVVDGDYGIRSLCLGLPTSYKVDRGNQRDTKLLESIPRLASGSTTFRS